ncbi:glycosyltransferase family 2 protein [Arenimonas metalli]|uniref:glycosyltransferase family 2 protein n=1 Tax=Arenimonas metalli TaxID=948077 RepID=UPI000554D6DA|nr:glycosyltransferase family 2 protein [Arenimonas metalli]
MTPAFQPLVVIPVFDHEHAIGDVVARVRRHGVDCLLVDDGSSPACASVLDQLATQPGVSLLRLPVNQGKGGAVIAGLREAARRGHSHALQIDADGQHDADDVPRFLEQARAHPEAVINGRPIFDASVPKARLYGRYATHVWVWINTLSFEIIDSMCGFRVYPLAPTLALLDRVRIGRRMDFDTEILVRLYWDGLRVRNLDTRVRYPADGVSHFQVWRDNVLITAMHTRLFFGMLGRLPRLLARKVARR